MFKFILLALCLLVLANSQSAALMECIQQKCPDQYATCKAKSGCEDTLKKCVNQCGERINQTCYTFCVGVTGPASALCLCAVNQKCITNVSMFQLIKDFFDAVTEKEVVNALPNA